MKVIKEDKESVVIEIGLLEFEDLQTFFLENKEAVDNTGKFEYEAIQKMLSIKMSIENNTNLNDLRLKRIDDAFSENKELLNK